MIRTYQHLLALPTFEERFQYLKLDGKVGQETFGFDRYLNQLLYTSDKWRRLRNQIIIRDNGCDLGIEGYDLHEGIIVHHMNPITIEDIKNVSDDIFNPEYLICTSLRTHNAIHYGDEKLLTQLPVERQPGDTCLWK